MEKRSCDYDDGIYIDEINDEDYKLIKMVDIFGREQSTLSTILFYIATMKLIRNLYHNPI